MALNADSEAAAASTRHETSSPLATQSRAYEGLSVRARLWVLAFGGLIALLNLGAAWYFSFNVGETLQFSKNDMAVLGEWLKLPVVDALSENHKYDLSARSLHALVLSKVIANKQGLVLACFGAGFALASIGFSLFVIGADGAFKLSSEFGSNARFVLSGTAPGLLCFVLAALLISTGVKRKAQIDLPPLASFAPAGTDSPCKQTGLDGKCLPD
jgi:hypothetical protein